MSSGKVLRLAWLTTLIVTLACGSIPTAPAPPQPSSTSSPWPGETAAASATSEPAASATPPGAVTVQPPAATVEWLPAAPARHRAGDTIELNEIHMVDASRGWGLSGADVLVTADGGSTWVEVTPPQVFSSTENARAIGHFADEENAWVVFTEDGVLGLQVTVWRSADGGRSWSAGESVFPQVIGEQTWAEFASAGRENLWLMARGVYLGAGTHYSHELFRSQDGGAGWASLDGETSDDFTGMVFVDDRHGLLTWQAVGAYAEAPPEYAVTSDGGMGWETRSLPPPPARPDAFTAFPYCEAYQPVMLHAASIRLLVGCSDFYDPPHDSVGFLYASDDGGATWSVTALPEGALPSRARLIYFGEDTALLLGREIFASEDGGASWSHVKTVTWDGQFSFIDSQHGWAVATAGEEVALVRTANGGRTWAEIKPKIGG